jgi:hypothetical protein
MQPNPMVTSASTAKPETATALKAAPMAPQTAPQSAAQTTAQHTTPKAAQKVALKVAQKAAQAAPQAPAPRPPHEPGNYWLSSLELRRGMEVEVLGMRHVPGEVLREFLRMHRAWEESRLPAAPRAASPLDIAFEADGSVTIPGDLQAAGA